MSFKVTYEIHGIPKIIPMRTDLMKIINGFWVNQDGHMAITNMDRVLWIMPHMITEVRQVKNDTNTY